ncbi:MAG: M20/M25/M40 family metallo-hydrolase [Planctomycetota bacterium]
MNRNAAIAAAVAKNRPRILTFLKDLVECNSYTHNKAGTDRIAKMVADAMPRGFEHQRIPNERYGDHHRFLLLREARPTTVLAGHLDTLCPPDDSFNRLTEKGDRLTGPGVYDMKGGDTVLIWALRVLDECDLLDDLSLICIFNGDEEVGSPTSNHIFTGMKGKAARAFVFEGGGTEGTVVTTRKGVARYRLRIEGRPAHFGCLKGRKISAVEELAHKVLAIESLNEPDGSLVANVGKVSGGLAANNVANDAAMDFEVRYWTADGEARALKAIEERMASVSVPGCALRLDRLSYRPPWQPTRESMALFDHIRAVAAPLGQTIIEEKRGGVSDANWLAHAGIPTIDGLGPIGDLDFTPDEYILTETLFQRIELTAHLLIGPQSSGG